MSTEKSSRLASKILPQFAAQIEGYLVTLEARFLNVLERVSAELESGTVYHAPDRAAMLVANFIGGIKSTDCCATGNTMVFSQLVNELNIELSKLRFVEPPKAQRVA